MKVFQFLPAISLAAVILFTSCKSTDKKTESETKEPTLKEENITYTGDSITMNGYVVYDENVKGARPAVLVVHEWWGLNEGVRAMADRLAGEGYIVLAVDLFGGTTAADPTEARNLMLGVVENP